MPEISVIIPLYNKEKTVEKAVRSVIDQPFRDIEVIVVNDGSSDGSLAIARKMAKDDGRIRVLDVPNGGVSSARNIGLDHARGDWIQFLDADDVLEAAYLSCAMQHLKEEPADILFSGFAMVDEQKHILQEVCLPESGVRDQSGLCACFIRYQYDTGYFGYISNKLFRAGLLKESGARFPEGVTLAEDLDFYARLYPKVKRAVFWEGRSFLYLQTADNYLHHPHIDYYSQLQIQLDIKAWFVQAGQYEAYRAILDGQVSRYAYYILFYDNEDGRDLTEAFRFLCERTDIMQCVFPGALSGFGRMILYCLRRRNLPGIRRLFACRDRARLLYRLVKRHG